MQKIRFSNYQVLAIVLQKRNLAVARESAWHLHKYRLGYHHLVRQVKDLPSPNNPLQVS